VYGDLFSCGNPYGAFACRQSPYRLVHGSEFQPVLLLKLAVAKRKVAIRISQEYIRKFYFIAGIATHDWVRIKSGLFQL
jgi:hypothetical protein